MIQIGIRGSMYSADEKDWAESVGIRIVHIEEFFWLGPERSMAEARRIVGDGPTYVSFDVDGLDPVYAPGTGTPEIGGFSTAEAQRMIRGSTGSTWSAAMSSRSRRPSIPRGTPRWSARHDVRDPLRAGRPGGARRGGEGLSTEDEVMARLLRPLAAAAALALLPALASAAVPGPG